MLSDTTRDDPYLRQMCLHRLIIKNDMTIPWESTSLKSFAHPFHKAPHKTLVTLSIPVLFSLVAEPLTGLVDTAFIARLGSSPMAALGVGTTILSGTFWAFNFLGIGSQTEVAQRLGQKDRTMAAAISAMALLLGAIIGLLLIGLGLLCILWGSGDFCYLCNVIMGVTLVSDLALLGLDLARPDALVWIWGITGGWVAGRAAFGVLRIWPGIGQSPFAPKGKVWHK